MRVTSRLVHAHGETGRIHAHVRSQHAREEPKQLYPSLVLCALLYSLTSVHAPSQGACVFGAYPVCLLGHVCACVRVCVCVCVCVMQDPSFLKRMSEWRFAEGSRISIDSSYDDHETDLRCVLTALREHLHAPGCTVMLFEPWDGARAQVLADMLPTMTHIHVALARKQLTDEHLSLALQAGGCLNGVSVGKLELKSSQSAGIPVHWGLLEVDCLDLGQIARLPRNCNGCTVRVDTLWLSTDAIIKVRHIACFVVVTLLIHVLPVTCPRLAL